MKKNILKSLLFLPVIIIISLYSCAKEETRDTKTHYTPVKIAQVEKEAVQFPVYSSGKLATTSEVKLSFKVGGIIDKIYINEGQTVKKGQLLASLKMEEIDARLAQARNSYEKANRDFTRVKRLYADSVVTLEQYQNTETALEVSEANLKIARFNQKYARIYAPDNGKILTQLAEPEELISAGYPAFLFGTGNSGWIAKVGISDQDIIRLKVGDSAVLTTDAYPELSFPAIVSEISEKATPQTGTFEIELSLEQPQVKLISGFIVKTEIFPSDDHEWVTVPIEAIIEGKGNEAFVFTYQNDSQTVKKTFVKTGKIIKDRIIIHNGILDGENVVTEGAAYLADNDKVNSGNM